MVLKNTSDGKKSLVKIGRFIINMLLLFSILKLSVKVNRYANKTQITSKNILICSELVNLPEKLCYVWVSTRDVVFRKYNLPCNNQYRYGLHLQINRKISHASILLLLAGDIATNPGPCSPGRLSRTNQPCVISSLNCLAINARSLKSSHLVNGQQISNFARFQELVYTENADLAFVTETWLNKDYSNAEILSNDYEIYRKDRGSRAGGVLLAVKSSSFHSVHEIVEEQCKLELVTVELTTNSRTKLCICCCYRPRNSDRNWLNLFDSYLAILSTCYDNIVIYGDFNLPKIIWDSPDQTTGSDELQFTELLNDYFLSQVNNQPTRGENILDLIITSAPDQVKVNDILLPQESGIVTDHNCIFVFEVKANIKAQTKQNRHVYDYLSP